MLACLHHYRKSVMIEFINTCLQKEDEFNIDELSQLHQWQLWQEEIMPGISLPPSLQKKCYEVCYLLLHMDFDHIL